MVSRVLLRRGVLIPPVPKLVLVDSSPEFKSVVAAWHRTPPRQPLICISLEEATRLELPVVIAMVASGDHSPQRQVLIDQLLDRDPRETSIVSPLQLLERQLERLPPVLLPDPWIDYQDLPWNRVFSLERQLKRVADLLVSAVLLLLTSPFLLLAMLLIWLEDRGPVFYCQMRSGWLGSCFQVYKLRTMTVSPQDAKAVWNLVIVALLELVVASSPAIRRIAAAD